MHCEQLESPKGMCRASASSDLVFSRTALQVAVQSSFFVKPLVVEYPMRKWMVQGPIKQNAYRLWMIMIDVNHSKILETPVLMTRFSSRLKSPRPGSMQLATHLHHPFHAVFCGRRRHGDQSRLQHLGPQIFWGKTRKSATDFSGQIVLKILQASPFSHCFADIFWTELIFGLLVGMFIVAFWKSGWGRIINQGLVGVDPPLPSDLETEQNASEQHQDVPRSFNNDITTGIWVIAGYKTGQQPFANDLALAIWYMTTLPCCSIAKDGYNFANIKPWAAQLAQGRCKWHHLRLETRRHPVSRRRAPATPAELLGAERLPPPRLPAAEFPLKPMGVGSPKIWRSNEMKTSPVNRNELCSSFSIMVPHFSIIWNRCFYPMSPQKTPPRPLLLDLRTSTNDEKVTVGTRHFNSDLFAKDIPKGLPCFDDCWYLLIVDATASLLQLWNERIYSIINIYILVYIYIQVYIMHGGDEHPFTTYFVSVH